MRKFEIVKDEFRKHPNVEIILPLRKTNHSAGYDFHLPCDIELFAHSSFLVWTDIKARMQYDEVLKLYIRSSLGIKKNIMLGNQTGIVDSDFYNNPDNDGGIGICLYNYGDKLIHLHKGDAVVQGIFEKYYTVAGDTVYGTRKGGIGSTGK